MTLYQMSALMAELYNALEDTELTDEEREQIIADNLEGIGADEKLDSYAKVIRQLEADKETVSNEIERLTAQKKRIVSAIDRMKEAVNLFMVVSGIEKTQTDLFKFSYRKSESVNIINEIDIPRQYGKEEYTFKPDKTAIKAAIKNGEFVPGCELVTERKVQIK